MGDYPTKDFEGKVSYQGTCRRRLWKRASLSIGAPLWNLVGGVHLLGTLRDNLRRALKMEHLSLWELWKGGSFTGDPEGYVKQRSGNGHVSPWGEPGRGLIYLGL
jgi:hypothetical protein